MEKDAWIGGGGLGRGGVSAATLLTAVTLSLRPQNIFFGSSPTNIIQIDTRTHTHKYVLLIIHTHIPKYTYTYIYTYTQIYIWGRVVGE